MSCRNAARNEFWRIYVATIAAAYHPDYEYYLLKVTSHGVVELKEKTTDDYGCTFPRGSAVLKGNIFIRENIIAMTYTLDNNKSAFVLAGTVWHMCGKPKHKSNQICKISSDMNEVIASL